MYVLLIISAGVAVAFVGATAGAIPALALVALLIPALVAVAGAHLFAVSTARILSESSGTDRATGGYDGSASTRMYGP